MCFPLTRSFILLPGHKQDRQHWSIWMAMASWLSRMKPVPSQTRMVVWDVREFRRRSWVKSLPSRMLYRLGCRCRRLLASRVSRFSCLFLFPISTSSLSIAKCRIILLSPSSSSLDLRCGGIPMSTCSHLHHLKLQWKDTLNPHARSLAHGFVGMPYHEPRFGRITPGFHHG